MSIKKLIWVGPRQSDISDCESRLFDGSITIFGRGFEGSAAGQKSVCEIPFNLSACSSDLYHNYFEDKLNIKRGPSNGKTGDLPELHRFDHNKYAWQVDLFILYYQLYLLSIESEIGRKCDPAIKKRFEYYFMSYNQNAVAREGTEIQFLLLAAILGYTGESCLKAVYADEKTAIGESDRGSHARETDNDYERMREIREHYGPELSESEVSFVYNFHKLFKNLKNLLEDKTISESDLTDKSDAVAEGPSDDPIQSRCNRLIDERMKASVTNEFRAVVSKIIDLGESITAMQVLEIQKLLYERSLCVNMNTNILDLLENKQRFRGELCRYLDIPAVEDVIISSRDNNNCTVGYLRKKVGGDAFVLQKPVSSGGHKTYFLRCPETEDPDYDKKVKAINKKIKDWVGSVDEMVVSQYRDPNVPFNVHAVIGSDQILLAPTSLQLIRNVNEKLIYCGADYPAYRQFVQDNPIISEEVSNYVIWLCKALQSRGYRGVVGFDYIVSDRVEFVESNNRFQASTPLINKALKEMRYQHDAEGNILNRFDGKRIVSGCSSPSMQMLNLFAFSNDKDPLMVDLSNTERRQYETKCKLCQFFIKRVYGDIDMSYMTFPIDRNDLLELNVPESMVIYYADYRNDRECRGNGMLTHPEHIWNRLRLFHDRNKADMSGTPVLKVPDTETFISYFGELINGDNKKLNLKSFNAICQDYTKMKQTSVSAGITMPESQVYLTSELKRVLVAISENLRSFFEYDCSTRGFSASLPGGLNDIIACIRKLYDFKGNGCQVDEYRFMFNIIRYIVVQCEAFDRYIEKRRKIQHNTDDMNAARFVRSVYVKIISESLSERGQKYSLGAKDVFGRSNQHKFFHDDNIDQYICEDSETSHDSIRYWRFIDRTIVKGDDIIALGHPIIDDGAFLFKMYVRGNVCSAHLGEPHSNPNVFAHSVRWNRLITDESKDNMLALKIGLINNGVLIRDARLGPNNSIVLHSPVKGDITIRRGVNHSVDIVVSCKEFRYRMIKYTSLPINTPCFTNLSNLSPFELEFQSDVTGDADAEAEAGAGTEGRSDDATCRLRIRYYGKVLRYDDGEKHSERSAELYLDVNSDGGLIKPRLTDSTMVPYSSIFLLATDRLRYQHCDHCKFAMNKVGCQFCEKTVNPPAEEYEFNQKEIIEVIKNTVNKSFNQTIGGKPKPARHVLIGGGSMSGPEFMVKARIINLCEAILKERKDVPIYLMCLPPSRLKDLDEYKMSGVTEVGFNIEIFDQKLAHRFMPGKSTITLSAYVSALRYATRVWTEPGQVRSALIIGLEDPDSSLECVKLLASLSVSPILSIFRPVPGTKLGYIMPMDSESLYDFFISSNTVCRKYGVEPGPSCIYCQNNTVAIPPELYDREVPALNKANRSGTP